MMRALSRVVLLAAALSLAGCASAPKEPESINAGDYISTTYAAVDHLLTQVEVNKSLTGDPIIVATLVNIDELSESSRLGRSVSEQVAARLTQRGFKVIELKLRGNLFVQRAQGELLLSRELKDITLSHQAQAVVVGTYSAAKNFIHVNLKMVSGNNQQALAATDYGLPLDANTRAMLPR